MPVQRRKDWDAHSAKHRLEARAVSCHNIGNLPSCDSASSGCLASCKAKREVGTET